MTRDGRPDPDSTGGGFFPKKDPRIDSVVMSTYRIVDKLAEGGMGTIYRARYLSSDEPLAIKFLRGEYSGQPEVAARFEREMKLLVVLAHENIVRALDCGKTPEGELYLVMELANGETLRAAQDRAGPLPLPTILAVARQIGAALTRAHSLGVIHRDLKPENVMVTGIETGEPKVKVLDFGMAGIQSGLFAGAALTQAGSVFGSPSYMSPEQALARKVDARGDQYAFGVMLYELLAGRKPFRSDDQIALLKMHIAEPLPPLSDTAPRVPEGVAAVVEKMLAKKPDERYPDVASAVDALMQADAASRAPAPPLLPPLESLAPLGGSAAGAAPGASASVAPPRAARPPWFGVAVSAGVALVVVVGVVIAVLAAR